MRTIKAGLAAGIALALWGASPGWAQGASPGWAQGMAVPQAAAGVAAAVAADGPVAWVNREPFRYAADLTGGGTQRPSLFGRTPGVPARVDGTQRLRVGLYPADAQGRVTGTAVLLDAAGRLVASGDVRGTQHGTACQLRVALGDEVAMLRGDCTPALLSGDFTVRQPARRFSLIRLLLAKGGGNSAGEAWLQAE